MNLPIEEIVWEDHFSSTDWVDKDSVVHDTVDAHYFITSIGYRLKETKARVTLIQNYSQLNGQVSNTMTILKKNIKSRTLIKDKD